MGSTIQMSATTPAAIAVEIVRRPRCVMQCCRER
jgi:hypothetical protein